MSLKSHMSIPSLSRDRIGLESPATFIAEASFGLGTSNPVDSSSDALAFRLNSVSYRRAKRVFDVLFSALILLFGSPLLLILAVSIKLCSRGPVFFKQERIGKNGKKFTMLKFRSMRVAAASQTDRSWRAEGDPRVTRLGAFLRRTNLDELPQFFNVLKGDMTVVGPRPERPFFVQEFSDKVPGYSLRHAGQVGITGWAQVNGWRGDTSISARANCDLEYYQNWSFVLDLRILWMTIVWRGHQADVPLLLSSHHASLPVSAAVGDVPYAQAHLIAGPDTPGTWLQPSVSAHRK